MARLAVDRPRRCLPKGRPEPAQKGWHNSGRGIGDYQGTMRQTERYWNDCLLPLFCAKKRYIEYLSGLCDYRGGSPRFMKPTYSDKPGPPMSYRKKVLLLSGIDHFCRRRSWQRLRRESQLSRETFGTSCWREGAFCLSGAWHRMAI